MSKCQCPMCKEFFDAAQEFMGKQAQCPYCNQVIIIQPGNQGHPQYSSVQNQSIPKETAEPNGKSTASLVLGIVGLVAWLIPLVGLPVTIIGLILGIRRKYTTGIVLNVIGLSITIINSAIGAVLGAQGQF